MKKDKSLSVLLSFIAQLKDVKDRTIVMNELYDVLIARGVCTEDDIFARLRIFDTMVSEIEQKLATGVSYNEAYRMISRKYSEFNIFNLN